MGSDRIDPGRNSGDSHSMTDTPIRDAATVILLRDPDKEPRVLMGQRGKTAAFMPNKYVFPGGAVEPEDAQIVLDHLPDPLSLSRLSQHAPNGLDHAIIAAAIREVWEETGLCFGVPAAPSADAPLNWAPFFDTGYAPSAEGFHYVFRAITPPGRPRRFDARFFLVDASRASGDLDDFSNAEDELSHLHWVPLAQARSLNLPFITEVVLAELSALLQTGLPPSSVPFFNNTTETSEFLRIP